jgi:hypothetical protein
MSEEKPPKSKTKPDRQFDIVVIKMMGALALSVAFLFGGGAIFVYATFGSFSIPGYDPIFGTILGVHIALLMVYYSLSLFKYIVSD